MEKKELRALVTGERDGLDRAYISSAGRRMTELLVESELFQEAENIFLYLSTEREPDTRQILSEALQCGKQVYVPGKVRNGSMEAVRLTEDMVLRKGAFGIEEPACTDDTETADRLDLILVPCITAGKDGGRLGHGGGYYDRYLAGSPAVRMCLCFDALRREGLPMEANDVRMEYLVTEHGVFRCGDGGRNLHAKTGT